MYEGGCLCGAVRYEVHGAIRKIVMCHCSMCRKAQGTAFATNGFIDAGAFHFVAGEANLTGYESSPGQTKFFCKTCGSPIISRNVKRPDLVRLRIGTVDGDISERPGAHIFVSSTANWEPLEPSLPRYDSYEPER